MEYLAEGFVVNGELLAASKGVSELPHASWGLAYAEYDQWRQKAKHRLQLHD